MRDWRSHPGFHKNLRPPRNLIPPSRYDSCCRSGRPRCRDGRLPLVILVADHPDPFGPAGPRRGRPDDPAPAARPPRPARLDAPRVSTPWVCPSEGLLSDEPGRALPLRPRRRRGDDPGRADPAVVHRRRPRRGILLRPGGLAPRPPDPSSLSPRNRPRPPPRCVLPVSAAGGRRHLPSSTRAGRRTACRDPAGLHLSLTRTPHGAGPSCGLTILWRTL